MRSKLTDPVYGLLLVLPAFLIVVGILFLPTVYTVGLSLSNFSFIKGAARSFVGLANYLSIFANGEFRSSLVNTLFFTGVTVVIELALGMLLALILNRSFPMLGLLRTTILFPWALPTALNAIVWRWLFNPDFGLFNGIFVSLGFSSVKIDWLGGIPLSMYSMMTVAIWKTSSFMALILLTGLQTIPGDLYEAADIDGAAFWYKLRRITLPLLVPSILLALLFRSMDAFRAFELPFALTDGGPAGSTQTLSLFGYRQFFQFLKFDTGSAVSVVQFLIIMALGLLYMRLFRARSDE
ncbi:MAG TPA: sugar ABC transporter permease [Spirochaetia bacterium]|nr:sugar ABC transporter permease [Spirochaetia bacterium]